MSVLELHGAVQEQNLASDMCIHNYILHVETPNRTGVVLKTRNTTDRPFVRPFWLTQRSFVVAP